MAEWWEEYPEVVEFEVKQNHIDEGIARSCRTCPMAIALVDWCAANGLKNAVVSVMGGVVEIDCVFYSASHEMSWWIREFDSGRSVSPGVFKMVRDITNEEVKNG